MTREQFDQMAAEINYQWKTKAVTNWYMNGFDNTRWYVTDDEFVFAFSHFVYEDDFEDTFEEMDRIEQVTGGEFETERGEDYPHSFAIEDLSKISDELAKMLYKWSEFVEGVDDNFDNDEEEEED